MHSYLEIVDAIRQMSTSPKRDLESLWRRIIFNVLISNSAFEHDDLQKAIKVE